jgi:hypothetical protein
MKKLFAFLMFSIFTLSYVEGGGKTQGSGNVGVVDPVVQSNTASQTIEPQKFALVIGNGNYTGLTRLANPVNDANDMAAALQDLGFTVDKILDGSLDQIENAVIRLKNRLSVSKNSYGFFFYAGHGVQSNGVNYLIPVGANIASENSLRDRGVSVQWALNELNDAGNDLNVVVLDACRDNPFAWARSGNRGLAVLSGQPADSIIVYATSAGSTAADGTGRNGLFTAQLLKNIAIPGLEVKELFNRTGADVALVSNRQQIPAVYNQFFGSAYLGPAPVVPAPPPPSSVAVGAITVTSAIAGEILIDGDVTGISVKDGGTATITNVSTGNTEVAVKESSGAITKAPQMVMVLEGQVVSAVIEQPVSAPPPSPALAVELVAMPQSGLTPQPAPMPLPSDQNQTAGKTVSYGAMNIAFGLGSYLQGDTTGGLIVTGGYAAALGLIAWDLNLQRGDSMAGVAGPIGIGVGVATLIFGFVKPFIYSGNSQLAPAMSNFDIELVSGVQNKKVVALKYTHSF